MVILLFAFSYASSVCELFFSMLKRTDINPEKIPTGKARLSEVAKLFHNRILEIRQDTLVLHWHHIILHLFKYLQLDDL